MVEATTLSSTRSPVRAYLVIGVGIMAVSLAAIFIRLAQLEGIPSLLIAAGRLTLAALILAPVTLWNYHAQLRRLRQSDLLLSGVSGLFLALHFATWIYSIEYVSVLISVVLISTSPLWIALLEVVVLKTRLGPLVLVGLITAIIGGIAIAVSGADSIAPGQNPPLGGLLAVSGAAAFAIYMVIGRKLRAQLQLLPYIWLVYSCAAGILIIVVIIAGIPITGYRVEGYAWVVALALIPQLIGHSSFNYAVKYLPATFIGIAGQLEPVVSSIIAVFVLREQVPQNTQIWGSIAILVGVVLAGLGQSNSK